MEEYRSKMIKLHATLFQNISKSTSKNRPGTNPVGGGHRGALYGALLGDRIRPPLPTRNRTNHCRVCPCLGVPWEPWEVGPEAHRPPLGEDALSRGLRGERSSPYYSLGVSPPDGPTRCSGTVRGSRRAFYRFFRLSWETSRTQPSPYLGGLRPPRPT